MPRFGFSLRNRRAGNTLRAAHTSTATTTTTVPAPVAARTTKRGWPSPTSVVLRGPQLLLRGPRLLLRAPVAVLRAPGRVARFSTTRMRSRINPGQDEPITGGDKGPGPKGTDETKSFAARLRQRWSSTPTKWSPIPLSLGAALLVALSFYKQGGWQGVKDGQAPVPDAHIKIEGPWQVHVLGALPLRSISRLWGDFNSLQLPVWFRAPGYKLYSFIFGVKLDECERDLKEYRTMGEFFMRRLKPGARPIASAQLVSPADGRIINFGSVEGGRVGGIKGGTYSLDALLNGTGQIDESHPKPPPYVHKPHPHNTEEIAVDEKEFANVNGITYSLDDLLGQGKSDKGGEKTKDASLSPAQQPDGLKRTLSSDARVGLEVGKASLPWAGAKEGNKLFFTVIYLAPGDYHRYHSPTNWVVERRRHFAGELFSVSPWMLGKLQDLFVLNERVALLGRWRHGFFSMVPVGATNVGSIRVNFDSSLRTNSPQRPITPGTFDEATYANASKTLGGQPLRAGDEIGGFWLGSTIVLVFEAPESFKFNLQTGEHVQVGQKLGDVESSS